MASTATHNSVILVGNVGAEPKVKYLEPGLCSAQFPLATECDASLTPQGHQVVGTVTEWHSILAFRQLAEQVEVEVRKGMLLRIEGRLSYREWRSKGGEKRKSAVIIAHSLEVLHHATPTPPPTAEPEAPDNPYGIYLSRLEQDQSGLPF